MRYLRSLDRLLAYIESVVIVTLAGAALVLGVAQVVLRYVFNTGFPWTESVFVTVTIWAMLFGGSRAVRDHVHVRVDLLEMLVPRAVGRVLELVGMLAALALSVFFFYDGLQYVRFVNQMDIRGIATQIPDAITYAIVPIAMAAFAIRYVILIVSRLHEPREATLPASPGVEDGVA